MIEKLPETGCQSVGEHRDKINELVDFANSVVSTAGGLEFQEPLQEKTKVSPMPDKLTITVTPNDRRGSTSRSKKEAFAFAKRKFAEQNADMKWYDIESERTDRATGNKIFNFRKRKERAA